MNRIFAAILATVFASSAFGHGNDGDAFGRGVLQACYRTKYVCFNK